MPAEALISSYMSDHDAHASDELDPDEPQTPWWMPLLGGFLFLMAALIAVAVSGSEEADTENARGEAPAEEAAAAPPGQAPPGAHPAGRDHAGHGHD